MGAVVGGRGPDPGTEAALRALAVGYADACDRRDGSAFVGLFAPDAVLTVHHPDGSASVRRGRGELGEVPGLLARYTHTLHLLGQSSYAVAAGRADGHVVCVAHHVRGPADRREDLVMYIRYEDRYRRDGGAWRIAERHVHVLWTERHTVA